MSGPESLSEDANRPTFCAELDVRCIGNSTSWSRIMTVKWCRIRSESVAFSLKQITKLLSFGRGSLARHHDHVGSVRFADAGHEGGAGRHRGGAGHPQTFNRRSHGRRPTSGHIVRRSALPAASSAGQPAKPAERSQASWRMRSPSVL